MNKDKIINNFYENVFQLTTDPLYVYPEVPEPEAQAEVPGENTAKTIPLVQSQSKKKNNFPSLFSALKQAQSSSVIKIQTGLCAQNNELNTPGVRIQNSEPSSNAVLVSEEFPTLVIQLPNKQDKVSLEGLKFAHICHPSKNIIRWPGIRVVRDNRYRPLKTDQSINTSILIRKGTLQIDECRFSLTAQKDARRLCASIIVEEEGSLVITRSELVGSVGTIGIYCMGGRANIRECIFKEHGGIAVWVNGGPETSLILKNSTIVKCAQGVVLNGPFSSSVQNNNISQCSGSGIITLFGNSSNIINNEVKECKYGIEVENSSPKVMKNNLISNKEFGLCSWSKQNGQCWPTLRFNLISENKKGGMLVWGSRNKSEVSNNLVRLNQKVGIKIESNAHPHIFLNQVTATFGNGVYICGGGTSFLQKNLISGSLNCNLVLEGPRNIDNYIYNNRIEGARGQGMFLMHCEKFLIAKNTISSNYNGIACVTSVVNIEDNLISNNKCNGIMLVDDCQVLMSENTFTGNRKAGFVSRNSSRAKMRLNKFEGNTIEAVAQNGWEGISDLEEENFFEEEADLRTPGSLICQLI